MRAPGGDSRPRWPYFGQAQKVLAGCAVGMWVGSSLPWLILRPLDFYGSASALARAWTLWAGLMTLGAAIARWPLVALLSAVGGGAVAAYLGVWQIWRVADLCSYRQMLELNCVPGPGVVITLAAGVLAMWQGWRLRTLLGRSAP